MGKNDTALSVWLSNKQRFADLFNGTIFLGQQIVDSADLEPFDSKSEELLTDKDSNLQELKRYRDVIMRWKNNTNLVLLACENQEEVHYAMPVRAMIYDGLNYLEQIRALRQENKGKAKTTAEFLSGFSKSDRLHPTITLVVYYGDEEWDGSLNLHDMMNFDDLPFPNSLLQRYISDYHINLIDLRHMKNVKTFRTDLQLIIQMLQYEKTKQKLWSFIHQNSPYFKSVDIDTYNVIRLLLKSQKIFKEIKKIRNQEVQVDMCKALEDLYNDGVEAGRLAGLEAGIAEKLTELVQKKLAKGLSAEAIADILEEDLPVIESIILKLKANK